MSFVYLLWFMVLCDPQWWIAAQGATFMRHAPTALFAVLLAMVAFRPPRAWFPAFAAFIALTVSLIPFAYNRGYAMIPTKQLVGYYVLAVGTLAFVRGSRQTATIVAGTMMYSYIWWILLGAKDGLVAWHPALANYDSYGPLMCVGMGTSFYYGLATRAKRERWLAFATALGCVVGLVSSFARGAVLVGGLVLFWIWLRTKRKGVATVALAAAAVVVLIAGQVIKGVGTGRSDYSTDFWTEMSTVVDQGGTKEDREVLWNLAWRTYLNNPIAGVGAENFGPYAAEHFRAGDTGGEYDENPGRLYSRKLHSTYFQLLAEFGTLGSLIFLWMVVDFFVRNRALRSPAYTMQWAAKSGGRLDLRQLSYGLEVGMVAYLGGGLFYNQIFSVHWFYTLLIVNALLYYEARPRPQPHAQPRPEHRLA